MRLESGVTMNRNGCVFNGKRSRLVVWKKVAQRKDHLSPESVLFFLPQNAAFSGHMYSLEKRDKLWPVSCLLICYNCIMCSSDVIDLSFSELTDASLRAWSTPAGCTVQPTLDTNTGFDKVGLSAFLWCHILGVVTSVKWGVTPLLEAHRLIISLLVNIYILNIAQHFTDFHSATPRTTGGLNEDLSRMTCLISPALWLLLLVVSPMTEWLLWLQVSPSCPSTSCKQPQSWTKPKKVIYSNKNHLWDARFLWTLI